MEAAPDKPVNHCAGCSACCKLLKIPNDDGSILSAFQHWCQHAVRPGGGCGIYPDRPMACRVFSCLWNDSQERVPEERMPAEMRPDRCHVVFGPYDPEHPNTLHVHVDKQNPMAWKRKDVKRWIERIVNRRTPDGRRITVVLSVGTKHTTIRADLANMRKTGPRNIPVARMTPAVGMRSA